MKNRPDHTPRSFWTNVKNALSGIIYALQTEKHMQFHVFAALVVVICSVYFGIQVVEWLFVVYAISSVIVAELFNTAIERAVDLAKPEFHPVAGIAKDVAAGAVLVTAIQSIIIGIIIFFPYIF